MIDELKDADTIVIKIGTSTLVDGNNSLDMNTVRSFVEDVADLWRQGKKVAIVTSGAVCLGTKGEGCDVRTAAMRGQPMLMHVYYELFKNHGIDIGQLLLTNEQFANEEGRERFVDAVSRAFKEGTVIIINENDPISTEKTTMGDNDALAARVTLELKADALVMLSTKNGTKGKGGGGAKMRAVCDVEAEGIRALILDGKTEHAIRKMMCGDRSGMENVEDLKAIARVSQKLKN